MTNSPKLTTFLFFSNSEAVALCHAAGALLMWAGNSFTHLFRPTRKILSAVEAPDHKIAKDECINLMALLGTCALSCEVEDNREIRQYYESCMMILSKSLANLPE